MKQSLMFQTCGVAFLSLLCLSGQSPRKELHPAPSTQGDLSRFESEREARDAEEAPSKSAAQKVREEVPHSDETTRKSAAQKVVEQEWRGFFTHRQGPW